MLKLQTAMFFFKGCVPGHTKFSKCEVWGHTGHTKSYSKEWIWRLYLGVKTQNYGPPNPLKMVNLSRKAPGDLASYFWDTPIWILRVWNSRNYGIQTVLCAAFRNPNKSNASFESKFQLCQTLIWLMFHPCFVKVFRLVGGPLSFFLFPVAFFHGKSCPHTGNFFSQLHWLRIHTKTSPLRSGLRGEKCGILWVSPGFLMQKGLVRFFCTVNSKCFMHSLIKSYWFTTTWKLWKKVPTTYLCEVMENCLE